MSTVLRMSYYGNPFLGLFFRANNSIVFAPVNSSEKIISRLNDAFKVKIVKISFFNSDLIGLYTVMNNYGVIVPDIIESEELAMLKKELKEQGLNIFVSAELNNAHGNNICANDKGGIINPRINSAEKKKMEDALGVELVPLSIAHYNTVGSACIATNKGFLAHYAANESEIKSIERALRVPGDRGTANTGIGFIGISAIVNDNNFIIGEASSGFEIGKLQNALGYI